MKGKRGQVRIDAPRDRDFSFEPQLVKKGQTRFDGLDEKMYACGMTQREIQGHPEEIYVVEISPGLISTITDEVLDEVRAWQARPLDSVYPALYLDAGEQEPGAAAERRGRLQADVLSLAQPQQEVDNAHPELGVRP